MDSSDLISQPWSEKRDSVWNSLLQSTRSQNALRSKCRTSDIKYATFFIFEKNSPLFAFFGVFWMTLALLMQCNQLLESFRQFFAKKKIKNIWSNYCLYLYLIKWSAGKGGVQLIYAPKRKFGMNLLKDICSIRIEGKLAFG